MRYAFGNVYLRLENFQIHIIRICAIVSCFALFLRLDTFFIWNSQYLVTGFVTSVFVYNFIVFYNFIVTFFHQNQVTYSQSYTYALQSENRVELSIGNCLTFTQLVTDPHSLLLNHSIYEMTILASIRIKYETPPGYLILYSEK